jgi:hypothetical protein
LTAGTYSYRLRASGFATNVPVSSVVSARAPGHAASKPSAAPAIFGTVPILPTAIGATNPQSVWGLVTKLLREQDDGVFA